jgi:diguanylate cyclase (GGDEF)-like protein/PAS domain S-box-containing protein
MTKRTIKRTPPATIPAEIYIAQVDSLYQEGRTLLVGYITVLGSILLTYGRTGDIALPATALLFTAISVVRALHMKAYARARSGIKSAEAARWWEVWYGVGAASSLATLGSWCALTLMRMDDGYAQLVSFSITIAYVIGITGRNFGSGRLVNIQILSVATPMIAALLIYGDGYYGGFAAALAMFFVSVSLICQRLRRNLLDAVISGLEFSRLAGRFDTALSNMTHGLCMFDAALRVVVANHKLNEQLGLPATLELKGQTLAELVVHCERAGALSKVSGNQFANRVTARLAGTEAGKFSVETRQHRALEFSVERMEGSGIVVLVEDITERKRTEAKVNQMARFDSLTGLFNRTVLQNHLQAAVTANAGKTFAVHFIDIDQFKQVNDTLGHSRGDLLLQIAADRLRRIIGPLDIVARFGGDEFVVIQAQVNEKSDASAFAERLLQTLRMSYNIDNTQLRGSASIGIAVVRDNEDDVERILRNADMALYAAKGAGRDGWCFFEPEMESAALSRRQLEADLRRALADGAFEIHYQPIVDLKTRRVQVCEALLRWPHPTRGMIPPAEFIPLAEEIGIITEIDRWVLQKACARCREWPDDVGVAVNLSALQFIDSDVPAAVNQALAAAGLAPHRLEIEITETILLHDTIKSREALDDLRALGVMVSLDDFGTKYSGLSYLHSFPLHKVKIDQSFVRNLSEGRMMTLLRGIARMSAELGLRVTVEGIETERQFALIAPESNIHEVQGYLFGRPMPASALHALLYSPGSLQIGKVA